MNMNNKFLKRISWFIFIFATIWGANLPGISLPGLTLYPIRVFILLWIFSRLLRINSNRIRICKMDITLIIFIIYGIACLIWSINVKASITSIIVYVTSIMTCIICRNESERQNDVQYACEAFYFNIFVMGCVAIYESYTGDYLSLSYGYYLTTYNELGLYRPIAAFYNTNNLAVFFLICLPIGMLATEGWKFRRIGKLFLILLSTFIIILTGSRTGIGGILLFMALYMYYKVYFKTRSKNVFLIILICITCGFSIIFLPGYLDKVFVVNPILNEDRWPIWQAAFQNCKDYLFMGAAPGTSEYLRGSMGLPHNYFLEILCEFGIIGFLSLISFFRCIFPKYKDIKKNQNTMYFSIVFWIFLVCTIGPSSMQGYYYIWAIFGISAAHKNLVAEY